MLGTVAMVDRRKGFCFAIVSEEVDGETRIFCHQEQMDFVIADLQVGDWLEIAGTESTMRGPRATRVTFHSRPEAERQIEGMVRRISATFCFVTTDDGRSVFISRKQFADFANGESQTFAKLVLGDRVRIGRVLEAIPNPMGYEVVMGSIAHNTRSAKVL